MKIDAEKGLLSCATYIASPNFNLRPAQTVIDMIVIHNISLPPNIFGGDDVIKLFTNQLKDSEKYPDLMTLRVSAHLFIRRAGEVIQFVPFHLRAFHAGISRYENQENCNDFSIGIELEGADTIEYTSDQYSQLRKIIFLLKQTYPSILSKRIIGHSDIAPGRKTDPGPFFQWALIQ